MHVDKALLCGKFFRSVLRAVHLLHHSWCIQYNEVGVFEVYCEVLHSLFPGINAYFCVQSQPVCGIAPTLLPYKVRSLSRRGGG